MAASTERRRKAVGPSIQLFDRNPSGCPLPSLQRLSEREGLRKEIIMQMPTIREGESLTCRCQGEAAGAVATMIIGFAWGGWTLGDSLWVHRHRSLCARLGVGNTLS
jgi:hypothetical protein